MHRLVAVVACAIPSIATADTADPQPIERPDEWLHQLAFGPQPLTSELGWAGHASLSGRAGRETGMLASVGGEAAWDIGRCRALAAGGDGAIDDDGVSGSAWAGFCLPFPINRFELTLRTDSQVQPGLVSLPIVRRSRFSAWTMDVRNTFIAWPGEQVDHEVLGLDFSIATFEQSGTSVGRGAFTLHVYRHSNHSTGRQLDVLAYALRASGPAEPAVGGGIYLSATAYDISPLRITRAAIADVAGYAIDADLDVGIGLAKIADPPPTRMGPSITRVRAHDLYADTQLRAARGGDVLSMRFRRAFEPTLTDDLLLDTRVEAGWTRRLDQERLGVGALAAMTRRIDREGSAGDTPSGGFRAAYSHQLPHRAQLSLQGEVAHSFYARLDEAVALGAAWTGQVTATVSVATP